uniref:Hemoglobin n=1 Tax=Gasterophilus intestinalis TaxID=84525 RepID=O96457_GASIN|nr:hemoglobin [Gasterophilus intestinalis]2C0K_A Chain A, HEMOGLOBIN [Gasterophilus intestinalis]2C0K_B Chain B, HEMOGLOBIN [Gasterophilus intestinalis]
MNSEEVNDIKRTWEVVAAKMTEAGVEMLKRYFKKYPHNLNHFPWFKEIPFDDLPENARFKTHGTRILRQVDEGVKALSVDFGDKKFDDVWKKLAQTHHEKKVERRSYNELKDIIIEVVCSCVKLNEKQVHAYHKFFDRAYDIAFAEMAKMG